MAHWSDAYVGLPYIIGEFDCVHLVVRVQNEVFERGICVDVEREGADPFKTSRQIDEHLSDYVERTHRPTDGDVVLMKCKGRLNHCGVLCEIDGVRYVLHNLRNVRSVMLHKVRDLNKVGIEVEGFYAVKNKKVKDDPSRLQQASAAA